MRLKLFILHLLLVSLARAATLQIMNLDDMTANSSAVVHGRIIASRADFADSSHKLVLTYYTLQADRYLKGNLGGAFEFTEPGGRIGTQMTVVPGAPEFQVGEELVLFVWTDDLHHRHQALGFEQGAFRVKHDAATGAHTLNHSQPLSGGGQVVESDHLDSAIRGPRTSRDLTQFLAQAGDSVRRVAARPAQGVK
jgi:hypothetical protein